MLSEAELLIIGAGVICPECGEKGGAKVSFTTTLAAIHSFEDTSGHFHDHDTNNVICDCVCKNGHNFSIHLYNSCFCGWTQSPEHPFGEKIDEITIKQNSHGNLGMHTTITEKESGGELNVQTTIYSEIGVEQ